MILFLGSLEYESYGILLIFLTFPDIFLQNKLIRLAWTYNQFCADLPDQYSRIKTRLYDM